MNISQKLSSLFHIQPGEGPLVGLMLAHHFCNGMMSIFTYSAAYSIFLIEFSATFLPYIYIYSSIVTILVSFLYIRVSSQISFSRLLLLNLGVILMINAAIPVSLGMTKARWLIFALPILSDLAGSLIVFEYWGLAARLFDVRQSKRLFGVLSGGRQAAEIICGFSLPSIVLLVGTSNLFVISVGAVIVSLILLGYILRVHAPQLTASTDETRSEKKKHAGLFKQRYVVLLVLLNFLTIVQFFFVDNIFYERASVQYPVEDQLSSFLGVFFAVASVVSLVGGVLLSGPFITRFGLKLSLLILPIMITGTTISTAFVGTMFGEVTLIFWIALIAKLLNSSLLESISGVSLSVLYQPLPAKHRARIQAMVDGIISSFASGLTGLLLLALTTGLGFDVIQLAYILLLILSMLFVVTLLLGREYPVMLRQALATRILGDTELEVLDAASIAILQQGLESPHVGVALYSFNMLESVKPELLAASLPKLLDHPESSIRLKTLEKIEQRALKHLLPVLKAKLPHETAPAIQGAMLRTLAALGDDVILRDVLPYLKAAQSEVRKGAIVGLFRSGGIHSADIANDLLRQARSQKPEERAFAAQVLGEIGSQNFYQPLVPLLKDEDVVVQREALVSAGKLKNPNLWSLVVEALDSPKVRSAAVFSLIAGGESVFSACEEVFLQKAYQPDLLVKLAYVYGRIRGKHAIALLKGHLTCPDERVLRQVLYSLSRCGYHVQDEEDIAQIRASISTEVANTAQLLAMMADLGNDPAMVLLYKTLLQKFHRTLERLFYLLSFLYDAHLILQAWENLEHPEAEKRAYALEGIDTLLAQEFKPWIFPLIEELPRSERLQRLSQHFPQTRVNLDQLVLNIVTGYQGQSNAWIRACAVYALLTPDIAHAEKVQIAMATLTDPSPLVKETAFWVLTQIDAPAAHQYASELQKHLHPHIARRIEQLKGEGETHMLTIEKVLFFRNVDLFTQISDEDLVWIADMAEEMSFEAGEQFITQGDPGDCLYITISGKVDIMLQGGGKVATRGERSVIGEMAILSKNPRTASCIAATDVSALKLDREEFLEVLREKPELSFGIIQVLVQRLDEVSHRVAQR